VNHASLAGGLNGNDDRRKSDDVAAAIVIRNVVKAYDEVIALADLSLTVRRGEVLGILGPNGCGKTTTINLLCGLTRPTAGSITVFGHDVVKHPESVRPLLGMVSQETALYDDLDARTNLMFHAELYRVPRRDRMRRIDESLELVGLRDRQHDRVGTFSGGMKRRVAIVRALLHNPLLIYLDEPTLGVDVPARRAIWNHILALRGQGKTVLLTTNYLEEASELCDRIAIMHEGRIVAIDTPDELRRMFGSTIVEIGVDQRPSADMLAQMRKAPGVVAVTTSDTRVDVAYAHGLADPATILNLLTRERELTSLTERHPTLDEVFLHLTGCDAPT
jgi:ABC-2 type transport system ATP-binding protein